MSSILQPMLDIIRHRGPDDEGMHIEGNLAIGMRRLSIIDLAGGRQPISNEDGSVIVVFNGEIYNYRELDRSFNGEGTSSRPPATQRSSSIFTKKRTRIV